MVFRQLALTSVHNSSLFVMSCAAFLSSVSGCGAQDPQSFLKAGGDHLHGPGCSEDEDIGTVSLVSRPSDSFEQQLSLVNFDSGDGAHLVAADEYLCQKGYEYDRVLFLCLKGERAIGPFPKAMVDKCLEFGGGDACTHETWEKSLASGIRGTEKCPRGTNMRMSGFCADGSDAYGPFTKNQVTACVVAKGGEACQLQRWNLKFAESLKVPGDQSQILKGLKIAVDSGHGGNPEGWEPGAVSPFYEKITDYALNISTTNEVKSYLESRGAQVSLFQYPNYLQGPGLEGRGARAKGHHVFLSVHYNRFNSVVQGSEVYTHSSIGSPSDAKLAYAIQDRMVSKIWNGGSAFNRGVKSANFAVLRGSAPAVEAAVLVEAFFLDHREGIVSIESRRKVSAIAIAEGIANYWLAR